MAKDLRGKSWDDLHKLWWVPAARHSLLQHRRCNLQMLLALFLPFAAVSAVIVQLRWLIAATRPRR